MFRICVLFFVCLSFAACNLIENKKLEFYYYPSKNIYYDVASAQFAYSLDGGKTWNFFKKDFVKDPATLGEKQVIYSDSPQPWNNNAGDIKKYNGKVYNIPFDDTTAQAEVVLNKKIIVKTSKQLDSTQPKEEKKPGFFKRLFGGRKKNN